MSEASDEDRVVGPIREAREPLYAGLRQLQVAAESLDGAEQRVAAAALESAVGYLERQLIPRLNAEEFTLFPAMDGVLGATGACQVMVAQHRAIEAMAHDLAQVVEAARTDADAAAYARYLLPLLHGLYALVRAHRIRGRRVPALLDEHLSESAGERIAENIERIASARTA
jgi:hypothetical protein